MKSKWLRRGGRIPFLTPDDRSPFGVIRSSLDVSPPARTCRHLAYWAILAVPTGATLEPNGSKKSRTEKLQWKKARKKEIRSITEHDHEEKDPVVRHGLKPP